MAGTDGQRASYAKVGILLPPLAPHSDGPALLFDCIFAGGASVRVGGWVSGGGLRWQRPCGELCQLAFRGPKTDRPRSVERVRVGCKTGANAQPCSCTLRPRRRRARYYYYYYCIYARRTQGHAGHAAEQAYAVLNERVGGCWWWW